MPEDYARLPQRRPSPRPVPMAERAYAPAVATLRPTPVAEEGLLDTLGKLWRHRWTIFACTVLLGGLAAFVAWALPSYYVAEARVLVGVSSPRVMNAEAIITETNPDAERVQNEGFILQSRTLAKKVIDKLHLADDPVFNPELQKPSIWARMNPLPAAMDWITHLRGSEQKRAPVDNSISARDNRLIDYMLGHVDVSLLGRSYVLSLKVDSTDPVKSAAVANTLAETYLDYQRAEKVATLDRVDKYLSGRISELRDSVRKSDKAVEDYRREHGLFKSSTAGGVTTQQLTELNTQLVAAQTAKAEAESKLNEAKAVGAGRIGDDSVPEVLRSPLIGALKTQAADAERKYADLAATLGPKHPQVMAARAEAGSAAGKVGAEVSRTVDGLAREARTADARYNALKQNFEKLKSQLGADNEQSIQLEALERDAVVNRNLLEAMMNRAKQSNGAEAILEANAKLVSPAAPPQAPAYPPKALIGFLGAFAGLMLGSAVALLRENNDRTFHRTDEVERLTGLPVLAMVPQVSGRGAPAMQVLRHPTSTYSESLRRVQTSIELSEAAASPKTILFNSATPVEGKSEMVASLGRLMGSNGRRVLLIDCDWRSPRLHSIFRCPSKHGLVDLLSDSTLRLDEILHHDTLSGADVLPAGEWTPRQAHLLTSDRMHRLIEALTPHYDCIILDTAPTLVTADVLALSRMIEKVVFVVRWGHTRQDAVVEALKQILDARGDVVGVVLSRVVAKSYRKYGYRDPYYEYSRQNRMRFT